MYRFVLAGLLPALCFASPGGAQGPPIVTEAEFLSVLDPSHPAVIERMEDLALARTRVVEASTFENPVLGAVREDPSGPVEQTDLLVSWQLPRPDRRPRIESRRKAVEGAEARLSQRLAELRLALRQVYAEWALASARQRRLADQAERLAALAERERERVRQGEASGLEARRLELAVASLRSRVTLAGAARDEARARATAWSPDLPPDALPRLPQLPAAPRPDAEHPLAEPPQVRAARAELAAALLEGRAAGRFVASPEVTVGWQRQEAGPAAIDGPVLGLAWSVPLFDRNQTARAASAAKIAAARARLEQAERRIGAARTAARTAFQRLSAARDEAAGSLAASERTLDGVEAAFRLGEASLTDLIDTHRSVTEAELAVLDLHEAALAAHRELERLAPDRSTFDPILTTLPDHPTHQETER